MQLNITARHFELKSEIADYIKKKLLKVKSHFERIIDVHVVFDMEPKKNIKTIEISLSGEGKKFFVKQDGLDIMAIIDEAVGRMERQVRKYKERLKSHHHTTSKSINKEWGEFAKIIYFYNVDVRPKNLHEALLQLYTNNHQFEIFYEDIESKYPTVISNCGDNKYEIIKKEDKWIKNTIEFDGKDIKHINQEDSCDIDNMTIEEALQKIESGDKNYIVFFDGEHDSINILYKQKGSYGLITTEESR